MLKKKKTQPYKGQKEKKMWIYAEQGRQSLLNQLSGFLTKAAF